MKKLKKMMCVGEIKEINEEEKTLVAHVSTKDRDRDDEVITPKGVDLKSFKKNPVVLWAHNHWGPPIGKALWIKSDENGIIAKTKFAPDDFSQQIFTLFKEGFMKAFSIGFIPKKWTDGDGKKTPRRTYDESELLEYSAVPVPANPHALVMAFEKGFISEETKQALEKMEKDAIDEPEPDPAPEPTPTPEKKDDSPGIDEVIAELEQKDQEITALKDSLAVARYELYVALSNPRERTISEISGASLKKIIDEGITGGIREVTGRVF